MSAGQMPGPAIRRRGTNLTSLPRQVKGADPCCGYSSQVKDQRYVRREERVTIVRGPNPVNGSTREFRRIRPDPLVP